jgi:toxin secretion/phage lysis holin
MVKTIQEYMQGSFQELGSLCVVKGFLAAVWLWALEMVGYPDSAAVFLFYIWLIDFALGSFRAWRLNVFVKRRFFKGLAKLILYWLAIVVFIFVDKSIDKIWVGLPSLTAILIAFFSVNDALSCAEHLTFFGVPFPRALIERLRKYKADLNDSGTWNGEERRSKADV